MLDSKFISRLTIVITVAGASAASSRVGGQGDYFADAIDVLRSERVHRELKLAGAQVGQFRSLGDKLLNAQRRVLHESGGEGFDSISSKLRLEWERREAEGLRSLRAHLSAEQNLRLSQIWLQMKGAGALLDPTVHEKLRLSVSQREKVREIIVHSSGPRASEKVQRSPFEDQGRDSKLAKKNVLSAALLVLNADQSEAWRSLTGPQFDFRDGGKPVPEVVPSRLRPSPALPSPPLPSRAVPGLVGDEKGQNQGAE